MKYQILFSGQNEGKCFKMSSAGIILPSMKSIKCINLNKFKACSILGKIFSRPHIDIFFLFLKTGFDVSCNGDNLHEMSNHVFLEKLELYHQFIVC